MFRIFFLFFIVLIIPFQAEAYLDPGTLSYLVQIVVASIAGAIMMVGILWGRIKNFIISKFFTRRDNNEKTEK